MKRAGFFLRRTLGSFLRCISQTRAAVCIWADNALARFVHFLQGSITTVASVRLLLWTLRPLAPATYRGFQEGFGEIAGFELWNLTAPVKGHTIDSTVSRKTLVELGYRMPLAAIDEGRVKSAEGRTTEGGA